MYKITSSDIDTQIKIFQSELLNTQSNNWKERLQRRTLGEMIDYLKLIKTEIIINSISS